MRVRPRCNRPDGRHAPVCKVRTAILASGLGAAVLLPTLSVAQSPDTPIETIPVTPIDADNSRPGEKPETAPRMLEEIVVTATKQSTSVRDIPVSIDVMMGDDLAESGKTSLEQILEQSPGVSFSSSGGSEIRQQVVIRGVTASSTAGYGGATTGYLFNDVSLVNPSLAGSIPGIDPYDLSTVEVLKGPQGTLFGGAALAGAIRYVPNAPVYGEFSGSLAAGLVDLADSDGLGQEVMGRLNLPVGDAAALRIAVVKRERPGVLDDLTSGEDDIDERRNLQGRIIGAWQITDHLSGELTAHFFEAEADASGVTDNTQTRTTATRRYETPGDVSAQIYRGQLVYDFGAFSLTGVGSYVDKDSDSLYDLTAFQGFEWVPGLAVYQNFLATTEQTTGELRITSNERSQSDFWLLDSWSYLGGVYRLDADQVFNLPTYINLSGASALDALGLGGLGLGELVDPTVELFVGSDVSATAEETAVFFDVTKYLGYSWELNLGGRYFKQSGHGQFAGSINGLTTNSGESDLTEDGFNPKAALTWRPTDSISVIGSYARGFRFGGFNNNPLRDPDIPFTFYSDEIENYELGIRTQWLGGALRFDTTAFYIDWTNPQVRQSSQTTSTSYISNAGAARIQGVESALTAALPFNLTMLLNGSYLDARLTESFDAARGVAEEGSRLPATPFLTGSAALSHQALLGAWSLVSNLGYSYQSETNSGVSGFEVLPAYGLWNLALGATHSGTRFDTTFRISATNLFDKTVPANAFQGVSSTGGATNYGFIQPRTVIASVGVDF